MEDNKDNQTLFFNADADFDGMPDFCELLETNTEVVSRYSRKEALADGVLIDAGPLAQQLFISCPVAFTQAAWSECIDGPQFGQAGSEEARLWHVLRRLKFASRLQRGNVVRFTAKLWNEAGAPFDVRLRAESGPGDDLAPVLTIMLPHED